jgi:PEGA domain
MRWLRAVAVLAALGALAGAGAGCVRRELTVTSDPPGALVFLNDQEVGRTPLTRPFTFYGTYDVRVRKEGYQTLKTKSLVLAPWWQWVPIDLFAEALPLTDRQTKHFVLQVDPGATVGGASTAPSGPAEPADAIVQRATEQRAKMGPPATAPATKPATTQP